jgi:adenylate cyclase
MVESGVTQRVAAILAADAVGYSRLMADDEPATIDALDAARAVFIEHIESNQGRVVDTAGDSVLAVFETTEGAAVAAAAIQARLAEINDAMPAERRMPFRIGLHLGDIREKADGTVYGDGVNVAARLEGLAEPGRIVVSGSVHDSIRGRHGLQYHFLGEQAVKNIAEPVRAYLVLAEGETAPVAPKRRRLILAGALVALLALVVAFLWPADHHESLPEVATAEPEDPVLALPTGPAIAVLPFDNLTGDEARDYFVDGMTEEIIAELTRFPDLFVLARNTTFQFKDKAVDVSAIGRELGVGYIVEGSVRIDGDLVRVTAQMIDVETGGHLWAETYERALSAQSLFAVQDDITERLVGVIGGKHGVLARVAERRAHALPTESLSAYDCMLRSLVYHHVHTQAQHLISRDCLERAIELDPDYVDALAELAYIYVEEYRHDWNALPDAVARGMAMAERALVLDPTHPAAHWALALAHFSEGRLEPFYVEAERAIALNPNDSAVLLFAAHFMAPTGKWQRGLALMRKAQSLNPAGPAWSHFIFALDQYRRRDFAGARDRMNEVTAGSPMLIAMFNTAFQGQLGSAGDIDRALERLASVSPGFTIEVATRELVVKRNYEPALFEMIADGLRKAGVPEAALAPSRPVIAVLPFDNLSGDPEQEYFALGISEEIRTALGRFKDLRVAAPSSDVAAPAEAVEALGATYVIDGGVRRAGETVRVTVRLVEASGTQIWSDSFERELTASNLFAIQDDITTRVAVRIGGAAGIIIGEAERVNRAIPTDDMDAYDCVLRTWAFMADVSSAEKHAELRACNEAVVTGDPDYADAWANLAKLHNLEHLYGHNPLPNPLDRAAAAAQRAVTLDALSQEAAEAQAWTYFNRHELEAFFLEAERAIALNPYDQDTVTNLAWQIAYAGRWERGIGILEDALELNPEASAWIHIPLSINQFRLGDYQSALTESMMVNMPDYWRTWFVQTIALAQLGRMEEAEAALTRMLELYPGFADDPRGECSKWNWSADMVERMLDGLRKAGLPERTD